MRALNKFFFGLYKFNLIYRKEEKKQDERNALKIQVYL